SPIFDFRLSIFAGTQHMTLGAQPSRPCRWPRGRRAPAPTAYYGLLQDIECFEERPMVSTPGPWNPQLATLNPGRRNSHAHPGIPCRVLFAPGPFSTRIPGYIPGYQQKNDRRTDASSFTRSARRAGPGVHRLARVFISRATCSDDVMGLNSVL